ncbi:MAG: AI-2E family transporter [Kineosporiaceae bacterium]
MAAASDDAPASPSDSPAPAPDGQGVLERAVDKLAEATDSELPAPVSPTAPPAGPAPGTGSATGPGDRPPVGLSRGLTVLLGAGGLVLAVAGMQAFGSVLAPVLMALVLIVAVHPLQGWLIGRGVPRVPASLVTLLMAYLILVVLALSLVGAVARLAAELPNYQDQATTMYDNIRGWLDDRGVHDEQITDALKRFDPNSVVSVLQTVLSGTWAVLSNLTFILITMFFMALDAASFPRRLAAAGTLRPELVRALSDFARGTRRYLVVSTIFGLLVAVIDGIALQLIGVPLAWTWALLAFITNYIPNIGFVIGVIPPALLTLLDGGWQKAVIVVISYAVINFVIQSLVQPKFVGDAVNLSTTLTWLSLVFWSWVIGPLGAILALPLTLLVKAVLVDLDPATRWASPLISSSPELRPSRPHLPRGRGKGRDEDPAAAPAGAASEG